MDENQQNIVVSAIGQAQFPAADVATTLATAAGVYGLVPMSVLGNLLTAIWQAGLESVCSTAASALDMSATTLLAQWESGDVVTQVGYNDVSGSVSGTALWNALSA